MTGNKNLKQKNVGNPLYKKAAALSLSILILGVMDLMILQGDFWRSADVNTDVNTRSIERRHFSAAEEERREDAKAAAQKKRNLTIQNLILKTKTEDGLFRKGESIEISCLLKNTGEENANTSYVLRTNTQTLIEKNAELVKTGGEKEIQATFTPQESGIVFAACRADPQGKVSENNENDNREVMALAIQP